MSDLDLKNAYFDGLFADLDLMWMGQNTNHIPPHPKVREALMAAIADDRYHVYAPPAGLEALREGIVADLGIPGGKAFLTNGGVESLAMVVRALCGPGRNMVTTDPGWKWPILFARRAGAKVTEIPIWDPETHYKLTPAQLAAEVTPDTAVVYLVDPNNPLGVRYTEQELTAFAEIVRAQGAILIHDCTYRDFAEGHTPAARIAPDVAVTVVSFSKWLGFAGLRLGALVARGDLLERLAAFSDAPLGSGVVAQMGALAGLSVKTEWMETVQAVQRGNQAMIQDAIADLPGFALPVYPSHGNFLVVECAEAGIKPEALVAEYNQIGIMIRQGSYHTQRFGHRFIKVSTSVPMEWMRAFTDALPKMVEKARTRNAIPDLF
jgi:aspartate/methionine/tyrosine aminotransferase